MFVWVLTFFIITTSPEGKQQTTVVSDVFKTKHACELSAGSQAVAAHEADPKAWVDLGTAPCSKKKVR